MQGYYDISWQGPHENFHNGHKINGGETKHCPHSTDERLRPLDICKVSGDRLWSVPLGLIESLSSDRTVTTTLQIKDMISGMKVVHVKHILRCISLT